jgi:HKD family nuclease
MRVTEKTAILLRLSGFHYPHVITQPPKHDSILPNVKFIDGITCPGGMWCFNNEHKLICPKKYNINNTHYPAPLQTTVQKWLREEKDFQISIIPRLQSENWIYQSMITHVNPDPYLTRCIYTMDKCDSYEISLEEAFIKILSELM